MDSIIHLLHSIQSTRLAAAGSSTIVIYDHRMSLLKIFAFVLLIGVVLTFDQEIDFVWRKDWSFLKCVFIFVLSGFTGKHGFMRWCVQSSMYNDEFYHSVVQVVLTSELVLLLWIWVIYNRSKGILSFLGVLFVAQTAALFVILATSFAQLQITTTLIPNVKFCSLVKTPELFYWYWLPVLVYNSAILALFILKGTESFRVANTPHTNLFHDVYQRSFVNFLGIFVAYLLCCVFWIAADFSLGQIPVGFALSFSVTHASRLLINIRHAYYLREDLDLDRRTAPVVYAHETPREELLFELRALRLSKK
ncbi:hypothetical protein GGX14DRAFT_566056 [Mycena pura]|uniref:DUF6533 domain-containing protein n=1 Tax=Mycena pura TaxID=153505 RepID=A0AAD6YCT0_9AGAR|nr:hypothetical protein GGX14DRAFT_566056 [Mycena pura]